MLGDDPIGFLAWMLLLPLIAGAVIGALAALGIAIVAALTAANHGLAVVIRRKIDALRARAGERAAARSLAEAGDAEPRQASDPVDRTAP